METCFCTLSCPFRFPGRCWRDAVCRLPAQPPTQLPAPAGTQRGPQHTESQRRKWKVSGEGAYL